jgi:UDP-glucose 4-epimerase
MATLVTGGTGFVGSNVVKARAQRGHRVICFDLAPPDELVGHYLEPWSDQVVFVQGDIRSERYPDDVMAEDITEIVHAAVFTGFFAHEESAYGHAIVDINVTGTASVLELARRAQIERFVYVSSGAVYGGRRDPDEILSEDVSLNPRTLYELTKYASELLCRRYSDLHGFEAISVRLSGPYGPMERVTGHRAVQSLMKDWTGKLMRGEPIEVRDPSARQKFTYVKDIAEAISTVVDTPSLKHDVYNVCSAGSNTLGEVIEVLRKIEPTLEVKDRSASGPRMSESGPGELLDYMVKDPTRIRMDPTRIQEELGFEPRFDLVSGVRDYIRWRERCEFAE